MVGNISWFKSAPALWSCSIMSVLRDNPPVIKCVKLHYPFGILSLEIIMYRAGQLGKPLSVFNIGHIFWEEKRHKKNFTIACCNKKKCRTEWDFILWNKAGLHLWPQLLILLFHGELSASTWLLSATPGGDTVTQTELSCSTWVGMQPWGWVGISDWHWPPGKAVAQKMELHRIYLGTYLDSKVKHKLNPSQKYYWGGILIAGLGGFSSL